MGAQVNITLSIRTSHSWLRANVGYDWWAALGEMVSLRHFWPKVKRHGNGCWLLEGTGRVSYRGKQWLARRLVYVLTRGAVPTGNVGAVCGDPNCIAPMHLRPAERGRKRMAKVATTTKGPRHLYLVKGRRLSG